ncbi:mitochondrial import inner membrane translocase subunit Tim13 [Acipenser oxyrinchus oxyrinchus]|uniref:Mitochondrial import inner membrane translocase subunit n=1 Tax=Acipenser oxyrinchus oxyrinchus TaxID=40147 RepID=A0AAD8CE45_ACIOX|nr:mitochondrial import inner membrane translocase subunit Tim13 [Acipenser oxyrinchus oxyrinchus]
MDGFGSDFSSGAAGSGKMDPGTIMEQVKVQIAVANAQELLQRMTDKCFKKCVGKPGGSLDNSEQKCIAMCMDRYMDAWNTASRAYNSRLQRRERDLTTQLSAALPVPPENRRKRLWSKVYQARATWQ